MEEIVNKYLDNLKFLKNYSDNTIDAYRRDINKFFAYLDSKTLSLDEVNNDIIVDFLAQEMLNNISKRSNGRRIVSLRKFFEYLVINQRLPYNPFLGVSIPRIEKKLPDFLFEEEIEKIFELNKKRKDEMVLRDEAIIELLYASGLRVSELVNLKYENIDFENRILKVLGKGNKERLVPFTSYARDSLIKYSNKTRKKILKKNMIEEDYPYVFVNDKGHVLTTRGVEYILKNIETKANLNISLHPHKFRHSFATHLMNKGLDLRIIQELMGHSSLSSTQVYTHVSNKHVREVYDKAFPRK